MVASGYATILIRMTYALKRRILQQQLTDAL